MIVEKNSHINSTTIRLISKQHIELHSKCQVHQNDVKSQKKEKLNNQRRKMSYEGNKNILTK